MSVYFGYQMEEGSIRPHLEEGKQVEEVFQTYLKGLSLARTAEEVGLKKSHSQIGRILSNSVYLGTENYPKLVSQKLFDAVQEERQRRKNRQGKNFEVKEKELSIPQSFAWKKRGRVPAQPFKRARHIYQTIEVMT